MRSTSHPIARPGFGAREGRRGGLGWCDPWRLIGRRTRPIRGSRRRPRPNRSEPSEPHGLQPPARGREEPQPPSADLGHVQQQHQREWDTHNILSTRRRHLGRARDNRVGCPSVTITRLLIGVLNNRGANLVYLLLDSRGNTILQPITNGSSALVRASCSSCDCCRCGAWTKRGASLSWTGGTTPAAHSSRGYLGSPQCRPHPCSCRTTSSAPAGSQDRRCLPLTSGRCGPHPAPARHQRWHTTRSGNPHASRFVS